MHPVCSNPHNRGICVYTDEIVCRSLARHVHVPQPTGWRGCRCVNARDWWNREQTRTTTLTLTAPPSTYKGIQGSIGRIAKQANYAVLVHIARRQCQEK